MLFNNKATKPRQFVEISARYECKGCGHRFYRKNREDFSVNPLNTNEYNTRRKDLIAKLSAMVRECPKCKTKVNPS